MKRSHISDSIRILAGIITTVLGYVVYLNPHGISVGGLTGAAVLLNEHLRLPYTATLVTMNVGLFLWGLKVKGLSYVIRSFTAMTLLGVLLDTQFPCLAELSPANEGTAMVFGSIFTGMGYGLVVSADTSTGGSDLLAMILVRKVPHLTVGMVMNGLDIIVVLVGGIFTGARTILFSLVAVLLCNTCIDVTAFCFGDAEPPEWIIQLKQKGQALLKAEQFVRLKPYAACMVVCVILLVARSVTNHSVDSLFLSM